MWVSCGEESLLVLSLFTSIVCHGGPVDTPISCESETLLDINVFRQIVVIHPAIFIKSLALAKSALLSNAYFPPD